MSYYLNQSFGCQLLHLAILDESKRRKKLTEVFALITDDATLNLASRIKFTDNINSDIFNGRTTFSVDDSLGEEAQEERRDISAISETTVRVPCIPNLPEKLGPYQEIDSKVLGCINYDFRSIPELISVIPFLFCGDLLCLTCCHLRGIQSSFLG